MSAMSGGGIDSRCLFKEIDLFYEYTLDNFPIPPPVCGRLAIFAKNSFRCEVNYWTVYNLLIMNCVFTVVSLRKTELLWTHSGTSVLLRLVSIERP